MNNNMVPKPLELQFGSVQAAVGDLVSGYSSLVESLPNLSQRVSQMQSGTEDMATRLEEKMRYLVDGYEYLDMVSSQIPESLRETAAAHKKSLLEVTQILSPEEKHSLDKQTTQLERLKLELQSISHERTVFDVLTKYTLQNKHSFGTLRSSSQIGVPQQASYQNRTTGDYMSISKTKNKSHASLTSAASASQSIAGSALSTLRDPIQIPSFSSSLLSNCTYDLNSANTVKSKVV